MNKFYKVDFDKYCEAVVDHVACQAETYNDIKLPKRATMMSAGYDFYAPVSFDLEPGESIKIATGIGVLLDNDKYLMIAPRSSLGFKYFVYLANTIGVIDADYAGASNGGHIMIKLVNCGDECVHIKKGEAFAQGIILQYFKTDDDEVTQIRTGGFGSTNE